MMYVGSNKNNAERWDPPIRVELSRPRDPARARPVDGGEGRLCNLILRSCAPVLTVRAEAR